jgi:tetratricopeptide (TPR) repeat protein
MYGDFSCSRFCLLATLMFAPGVATAAPSVADALKLKPVQEGVNYDLPGAEDVARCTIQAEKVGGVTAWVVRGSSNQVLRQFSDGNADNVVDTWSYFRDGLEVYRDIDSNHNGKADQYRWFHSQGIRWALDTNEDNTVDTWKLISPEEVAAEVVESLANKDQARFRRLLMTPEDLKKLALDEARRKQLAERVAGAEEKFSLVAAEPSLKPGFQFSDFGGIRPGMVPAGSQGVSKDLMVYESVWAMIDNGGEPMQLQLGTLISLGGSWKLIDGPTLGTEKEVAGFFFDPGGRGIGERAIAEAEAAPSEKMQEILDKLQEVDAQLNAATADAKPKLNAERADLLLELANSTASDEERVQWLEQLADSVSAATQEGSFPEGVQYLKNLEQELAEDKSVGDLPAYIEFLRMSAEYYGVTLAQPGVDIGKAQEQWLKDLEGFVEKHPNNRHGAEAMRAIAMGYEMSGKTDQAVEWYRRILQDAPQDVAAELARGAVTRLTSEGSEIELKGTDLSGAEVDLNELRGKAVVIQYWTTTSDVCKADQAVLKDLVAKYGGQTLEVISVCLDFQRDSLVKYLQANKLPWKQLYEPGGFDGRLANEMGVVTVPLTIMVGPDGKVISNNIQVAEIESELKKL